MEPNCTENHGQGGECENCFILPDYHGSTIGLFSTFSFPILILKQDRESSRDTDLSTNFFMCGFPRAILVLTLQAGEG